MEVMMDTLGAMVAKHDESMRANWLVIKLFLCSVAAHQYEKKLNDESFEA